MPALGSRIPRGGALDVPQTISGLRRWWRSDVTVTQSGTVSAWADIVAGEVLAQATSGKRPAFTSSNAAVNNYASVDFDGTDDTLATSAFSSSLSLPATIFFVAKPGSNAATRALFDGIASGSRWSCQFDSATWATGGVPLVFSGGSSVQGVRDFSSTWIVGCITIDASGACTVYLNDAVTPLFSGSSGTHGLTGLTLGSNYLGTGNFSGSVCEIGIYDSVLSAGNIRTVMGYLGTRYALSVETAAPSDFGTLLAGYFADLGATISLTGRYSGLADKLSGLNDSGRNFSQGTDSARPTLNPKNSAYGNQVTAGFDAARYMRTGSFSAVPSEPVTAYFVGNTTDAAAFYALLDCADDTKSPRWQLASLITSGYARIYGGATLASTTAITSPQIVCARFLGTASSALYQGSYGTASATGSAGSTSGVGPFGLTLGALGDSGVTSKAKMTFAAALLYSGDHNSTTRQNVGALLARRYGLAWVA